MIRLSKSKIGYGDEVLVPSMTYLATLAANCVSIPNDPQEIERKLAFDSSIPYDWGIKHK